MNDNLETLRAQRDALLAAIREALVLIRHDAESNRIFDAIDILESAAAKTEAFAGSGGNHDAMLTMLRATLAYILSLEGVLQLNPQDTAETAQLRAAIAEMEGTGAAA